MKKTSSRLVLALVGAVLLSTSALATTYYVDATQSGDSANGLTWETAKQTIQAAADLAVDGDTVMVADGTYATGSVIPPDDTWPCRVYTDQAITLESVNGPEFTIIDGSQEARCVYLRAAAQLRGFTLTDGNAGTNTLSSGGGLVAYSTDENEILISNCIIKNSHANFYGGGVYLSNGTMTNCTVEGNASESNAGGVYLSQSTLQHCTIEENTAAQNGGGVYAQESRLEFCTISDNTAGNIAGGLYLSASSASSCKILDNESVSGGACHLYDDSNFGMATLNSCLIARNHSAPNAVVTFAGGTLNFCTIVDNEGSGVGTDPEEINSCIIWDNSLGDIQGWSWLSDIHDSCSPDLDDFNGCITNAPNFCQGSYRLMPDSPCLNQGDETDAPAYDLDGRPRVMHHADMGAYESAFPLFVDANQPDDSASGVFATQAKRTLQAGAELAAEIIEAGSLDYIDVWVAAGTYAENGAAAPSQTHTNRLVVPQNVRFIGTEGRSETFIDGSSLVRGVYVCSNAYVTGFTIQNGITFASGTDEECSGGGAFLQAGAQMVRCILENNVATAHGGGAFLASGSQMTSCSFEYNSATNDGGGAYLSSQTSAKYCYTDHDQCGRYGGGMYLTEATAQTCGSWGCRALEGGGFYLANGSSLNGGGARIEYCRATGSGGGAYVVDSTITDFLTIGDCDAGEHGGALYLGGGSTVKNMNISLNSAQQYGGGIYALGENQIEGVEIKSNLASSGAALYLKGTSATERTQVNHVIADGNAATDSKGAGVYINYSGILRNCNITDNTGIGLKLYLGKTIGLPAFGVGAYVYNSIVWGNSLGDIETFGSHTIANTCASDGVTHLENGCLAINPLFGSGANLSSNSPCINCGDDEKVTSSVDYYGNPRFVLTASDIGAVESSWDTQTTDLDIDGMPDTWEGRYYTGIQLCDRTVDDDNDGYSNFEEYLIGSNPTNRQSNLNFTVGAPSDPTDEIVELHWTQHPTETRYYTLEWAPTLTNDFEVLMSRNNSLDSYPITDDDLDEYEVYSSGFFRLKVDQ
jgi:parallel beta-helix repeat protein